MRKPICLAAFAVWALGAPPVFAQPVKRDHRKPKAPEKAAPVKRDHRKAPPGPEVRDHRRPKKPPGPFVKAFGPKKGPAGTKVTIKGRGMMRVTKVIFGKREIAPDSVARGQLTFTVPDVKKPGPRRILLKHPRDDIKVGRFMVGASEQVPATRPEPVDDSVPPPPDSPPPAADPADPRLPPPPPPRRWHRKRLMVGSYWPHHGKPGTKVTIRGRNFDPDVKVMFSGQEAKVLRVKPRRITFKIPKRQGDGLILLHRAGAKRALVVGPFDVNRAFDAKEAKRMRAELRKKAEERWAKRKLALAKTKAERRKVMEVREQQMRKTRVERRKRRAKALRARWQRDFLSDPQVQAEMSLHAERMARLARMRRLADADAHGKIVVRIDVTSQRETARHNRRMATLKTHFKVH